MSALGHKRTSRHVWIMSALPPKADIDAQSVNVRFVPKADISLNSLVGAHHVSAASLVLEVGNGAVNLFLTITWRAAPQFGTVRTRILQASLSVECGSRSRRGRHDLPSLERKIEDYFCCRTGGNLHRWSACGRWTSRPCSGFRSHSAAKRMGRVLHRI